MNPISPDLDPKIRQVIRQCGLQAEQMALQPFEVSEKGPEDYVTSIDKALDRQLLAAFSGLFPEDGVITEEDERSRQQFHTSQSRLWCIDPLDGTEDFIQKRRNYSVMVGLLEDRQPTLGWIYAPSYDQMYFGGVGWGLFQTSADQDPKPLSVAEPSPETACRILIGHRDRKRYGSAIAQQIPSARFYSLGSFGLKVMEVILGRTGVYLYLNGRVKIWDTAGPLALAIAAGLKCCTLEGHPIQFSSDQIDPDTLAHQQSILIGWPHYIDQFRPKIAEAVQIALHL